MFISISSLLFIALIHQYSSLLLALLGDQYSGLGKELTAMAALSCISFISMTVSSLNYSKAWIIPPIIFIPSQLITQILLILVLDLSQTLSVIFLSIIHALVLVSLNLSYTYLKLRELTFLKDGAGGK